MEFDFCVSFGVWNFGKFVCFHRHTYKKLSHISIALVSVGVTMLTLSFSFRVPSFFILLFAFISEFTPVATHHSITTKRDQNITKMDDTFRASSHYLIHKPCTTAASSTFLLESLFIYLSQLISSLQNHCYSFHLISTFKF